MKLTFLILVSHKNPWAGPTENENEREDQLMKRNESYTVRPVLPDPRKTVDRSGGPKKQSCIVNLWGAVKHEKGNLLTRQVNNG